MNTHNCLICGLEAQYQSDLDPLGSRRRVQCDRCGKYDINDPALTMLEKIDSPKIRGKLIAWIRDKHERGIERPDINVDVLKNIVSGLPEYTPTQKQLMLMQNIERRTEFPGKSVNVAPKIDYPLSWASCQEELIHYLRSLVERGLLRLKDQDEINDMSNIVEITASGWDYLEKNSKKSVISDQSFVAMSFSASLNQIWKNAIKRGIEEAGYKAYRTDAEPHSDRIDTKIIAEIKNSKFLVADVTEQKQGVYFEAGYALGLGLPVIWSCRKDDFKNVHFDTRQYNHIVWESEKDFKEQLYNFICAIVGKYS